MPREKARLILPVVLAITLIGGGLRFWKIGQRSYWTDEFFARKLSLEMEGLQGLKTLAVTGNTPLYFLALRAWRAFGDTEQSLRSLSAVCGTLSIPMVFFLGSLCLGGGAAQIGALLMALSPFQIMYAQTARPYALLAFWTLAALLAYLHAVRKGSSWGWAGYTAGSLLSLYTHYMGFSAVLVACCHFLLNRGMLRAHRRRFFMAHLAILALFTPWLVFLIVLLKQGGAGLFSEALHTTYAGRGLKALYIPFVFSLGESVAPWDLWSVLAAAGTFGLLLIRGLGGKGEAGSGVRFMGCMLFVPTAFWILLVPHVTANHLMAMAAAYLLILAKGAATLRRRAFRIGAVSAVCLLFAVSLSRYERKDPLHVHNTGTIIPWREVCGDLERHSQAGDLILVNSPFFLSVFNHYYRGEAGVIPVSSGDVGERLAGRLQRSRHAWLVLAYRDNLDERRRIRSWMDRRYKRLQERRLLRNEQIIRGLLEGDMHKYPFYALEIYQYDLMPEKASRP